MTASDAALRYWRAIRKLGKCATKARRARSLRRQLVLSLWANRWAKAADKYREAVKWPA